jgi:Bacterial SH3 domain
MSSRARDRSTLYLVFACVLVFAQLAMAERRGVIDDPDGFVNVRAEKTADAAVIATVKTGEPFTFEREGDDEWCKVTLASGKSGWMHLGRIRLHFTEKDLPTREEDPAGESEIDQFARGRGLNYAAVTRRAARGDSKALKQFFLLAQNADGAAAESISGVPTVVYHLLGDEKFAKFLSAQPLPFRMMVRNRILSDGLISPASLYLGRHFPQTAHLLFRREMIDWFSPNGLYAIRKIFSNEFELGGSKVVRAELIEKKTGRVLCDLTSDDIGTGAQREGEALWSPDSKRVACLSSDLTEQRGNLFSTPRPAPLRKQTAVYQFSGDAFARVALPLSEVPGRESDTELERAILGHEYTEPLRWQKPNVLVLERHEYYEVKKPTEIEGTKFESIHGLGRLYQITATMSADGKATVAWKLRKD